MRIIGMLTREEEESSGDPCSKVGLAEKRFTKIKTLLKEINLANSFLSCFTSSHVFFFIGKLEF